MHIADGILSTPVLIAGTAAGTVGIAYGLRRLDTERIPQTAVLSAAFFVASLIHIPMPPSSVHLLLPGLLGMILGWSVFPALLVGLIMQFVFFSHGGLASLGVNLVNMAVPALCCYYLYGWAMRQTPPKATFFWGFMAGATGVILSCIMFAVSLYASKQAFLTVALASIGYHLPVAIIEGFVTGASVAFLRQVRPEVLAAHQAIPVGVPAE